MAVLKIDYKNDEWRLFIDSSKLSLKFVLLHNTNWFPSDNWLGSLHKRKI